MNFYIETLGCQMNKLDSEVAAAALQSAGHRQVKDLANAQIIIYNTCSVRKHAEQKVLSRIGGDRQRKATGMKIVVAVIGCMAQRMGKTIRSKYPQVDVVCSPGKLAELPAMIAAAAMGNTGVEIDPPRNAPPPGPEQLARLEQLDAGRDVNAPGQSAFVRVMRGCNFFCSYCIVPFVRGREESRPPENIADEVRRLVDAGKTEITLLGQTVNSYHWTSGDRTVRFSDLLAMVSPIAGLRRLRFVTSHPVDFGDDVLQAMADLPNVCPYIHCPAQSGSDEMLRRMNRGYTRADYDSFVDRAIAIVPNVVLAGDFIVGFPGETEDDHLASAELVRRSGYKNCFVFKYSPRPGTAAAKKYKDEISTEIKKRRNVELLAVQAEVGLLHHQKYVGKTVEVLVEGPSPKSAKRAASAGASANAAIQLTARTTGDHIVLFDADASLTGQYVNVKIESAGPLTLVGKLA